MPSTEEDHLPVPANCVNSDRSQAATGLLGHLSILLACVQLVLYVLYAVFQLLSPKPIAWGLLCPLYGIVMIKKQYPELHLD